MRTSCLLHRLLPVVAVSFLVGACQQADQDLPFDVLEDERASNSIGQSGGTISLAPGISIEFPSGSLTSTTTVDIERRVSGPFPGDAGAPVPGTSYDVGPVGTMLSAPARVELAVDPQLMEVAETVRLSVAVQRADGSVAIFPGAYDVTNAVLSADVDELGPMAAVIALDAIPVALESPPVLGGGSFPSPVAPSGVSGPALAHFGGVEFRAACAPNENARRCFSSGVIRVWADEVVTRRLGDHIFLLDPAVDATLEFLAVDAQTGLPTQVAGKISVEGDLRARFNSTVTSYEMTEGATTGTSGTPAPTGLAVIGNVLTIAESITAQQTLEFNQSVQFGISGIGTTVMMTVSVEADIEFNNSDGSTEIGTVIAHVRLRVPQT